MQVVETLLPWLATLFIGIVVGMALQKNRVRYIVDTIALTCGGYDQANEVLKALQAQLNQPANLVPTPTRLLCKTFKTNWRPTTNSLSSRCTKK
jgi:hypothetical protein